jgi:hypothetical protein
LALWDFRDHVPEPQLYFLKGLKAEGESPYAEIDIIRLDYMQMKIYWASTNDVAVPPSRIVRIHHRVQTMTPTTITGLQK